ncbi:MAG: DUF1698 domain-containing protein [Sphingobium sp.]|jgi:SAM-dependent methyltransferase|nr:DUF1698 domain-containing protein [Sphingobium sp.]MCP5399044.1 DUF1698 domain-containing protein [Sphingomonas sp.]
MSESIRDEIESHKWFHAIELGEGLSTQGRFPPSRPSNYTLYGSLAFLEHMDTSRAVCMDMGTMDGLIAFTLDRKGSAKVVATDIAPRASFELANNVLKSRVEYRVPVNVAELHKNEMPEFDLIVFSGILYHIFDPLSALVALRKNIKNNGYLLLETQYFYDENKAVLSYSPMDPKRGSIHANTFFQPSFSALTGMLETACFQVISTISIDSRITVLAQAKRPKDIKPSSAMVKAVLSRYRRYENYKESIDYQRLDRSSVDTDISYVGPGGHFYIFSGMFKTPNTLQPVWRGSFRQKTREFVKNLSFYLKTCICRRGVVPVWKNR